MDEMNVYLHSLNSHRSIITALLCSIRLHVDTVSSSRLVHTDVTKIRCIIYRFCSVWYGPHILNN